MKDIVVYIHGKNGSAAEAARYRRLFAGSDVLGFDYEARTPWEAKEEFAPYFESILKSRKSVTIVANGIGTFLLCTPCRTYTREGLFYLHYLDPKHDIAGKRERGGAAR